MERLQLGLRRAGKQQEAWKRLHPSGGEQAGKETDQVINMTGQGGSGHGGAQPLGAWGARVCPGEES